MPTSNTRDVIRSGAVQEDSSPIYTTSRHRPTDAPGWRAPEGTNQPTRRTGGRCTVRSGILTVYVLQLHVSGGYP
jgi:hypothetical protein